MSAVAAVLAHGGAAGMRSPAWLAAAVAGSVLVALGLAAAARRVATLHGRLSRIASGDIHACVVEGETEIGLATLIGAALACQGGAHIGLLAIGVHAHSGSAAAPALHVALAFAAALTAHLLDRVLGRLGLAVSHAVQALLALLTPPGPVRAAWSDDALRPHAARGTVRSRAPPLPA
jgi:hypothetical protein